MRRRQVLYISYDGMTDSLGASQVIPYLIGLSRLEHKITILSCEKPDRFEKIGKKTKQALLERNIEWHPISYHKSPPLLSTAFDLWRIFRSAKKLLSTNTFDTVHCRSYLPALVGLSLKLHRGLAFVFDMRGFWADERVDGNLWNLKNPIYLLVYRFFKKKESEFLASADVVISLTYSGKREMAKWPVQARSIEVIPCCVDLENFRREKVSAEMIARTAKRLSITPADKVLVYLGSVGTWYLLDEMLDFFNVLRRKDPSYRFLFITPGDRDLIRAHAAIRSIGKESLIITRATHEEVPLYLSLAHLGIFFIRPAYSKVGSSPTKLGELLAMEIPVVANGGVGDLEDIFQRYRVGRLIHKFGTSDYQSIVENVRELEQLPRTAIRAAAEDYFSLDLGINRYESIYERLPITKSADPR